MCMTTTIGQLRAKWTRWTITQTPGGELLCVQGGYHYTAGSIAEADEAMDAYVNHKGINAPSADGTRDRGGRADMTVEQLGAWLTEAEF
jgi:hypothetical protein